MQNKKLVRWRMNGVNASLHESIGEAGSELARGSHVHIGRVEAQLDVGLVAIDLAAGEFDTDEIRARRLRTENAMIEQELGDEAHDLGELGVLGEGRAFGGLVEHLG